MFCMKCGNEILEGANFCPKCGTKVGEKGNTESSQTSPKTISLNLDLNSIKGKAKNIASKAVDGAKDFSNNMSGVKPSDIIDGFKKPTENDLAQISSQYGKVIYSTAANMQYRNKITTALWAANKGGHLFLTEKCLYFKAHALNFGDKEWLLPLADIVGAGKSHQLNLLSVVLPNQIEVNTINGETYKFVVSFKERDPLAKLIMQYAAEVEPNSPKNTSDQPTTSETVEAPKASEKTVETPIQEAHNSESTLSPTDEIKKYKELLDMGAITQDEFDAKKKQLLNL